MPSQEVGAPIPDIPHAVSVTLPTWKATVGYEEGEEWVTSKMHSGYPRFFIHPLIQELATKLELKYGRPGESAMVFPSYNIGKRCRDFIKDQTELAKINVRLLQLSTPPPSSDYERSTVIASEICVVFFPSSEFRLAKNYWQHAGEGISSRMGEYVLRELFREKPPNTPLALAGNSPSHSNRNSLVKGDVSRPQTPEFSSFPAGVENPDLEYTKFVEQKFGRVLDLKFAPQAKNALRRRICGKLDKSHTQQEEMEKSRRGKNLSETDVYFYPTGMASIFNAHHSLLEVLGPKKSVCFGFPYVDTLSILRKFGPGVHFFGMGDDNAMDELERGLESKELDILALFCECPSNPLLKTPDLVRIRRLADKYNFAVVVDETVGNFLNIHVLPYADIVCSSLTKVFSGDSNVMAGSLILNPASRYYDVLKEYFNENYEDTFWAEDALYLERNSRDFVDRSTKIDATSLLTVEFLQKSPLISKVFYPSVNESKKYYDTVKTPSGGYGGLLSFLFHEPKRAIAFFDALDLHKGPSLGTNFTLACPYTILAHYHEIEDIAQWGVDRYLVRMSIGLEDPEALLAVLQLSLDAAGKV